MTLESRGLGGEHAGPSGPSTSASPVGSPNGASNRYVGGGRPLLRNKKGPLTMGKGACTVHVRGKSCMIEMRSGHGTIARAASPQRWSEGICKGKPGLSGPAGECAAAVEGREGRSRLSGAGLGACRVRVRPGNPYATWPRPCAPARRPATRPRESARAPWPGLRHRAGRPALMGRAVGAAGGQLAGGSWGRGAGGRRPVEERGRENCDERAALGGAGAETLTGGRQKA
jgi:hypothetical protein